MLCIIAVFASLTCLSARKYLKDFNVSKEVLAKLSVNDHLNASLNENAHLLCRFSISEFTPYIGNTYSGAMMVGLSAILDVAKDGDRILAFRWSFTDSFARTSLETLKSFGIHPIDENRSFDCIRRCSHKRRISGNQIRGV